MKLAHRGSQKVQTSLRLPRPLYEQAKQFVETGCTSAETINDYFVAAINVYSKMINRRRIDAAFAGMAEDAAYQKEVQILTEQFAHSDAEPQHVETEAKEEAHAAR